MRFSLSDELLSDLRKQRSERRGRRGFPPDMKEEEHDAFMLDAGMGPAVYLTVDGRLLLDGGWEGKNVREASDDEAIRYLVVGAKKTGIAALLDLVPRRPAHGTSCPECAGSRWCPTLAKRGVRVVCPRCHGRAWI